MHPSISGCCISLPVSPSEAVPHRSSTPPGRGVTGHVELGNNADAAVTGIPELQHTRWVTQLILSSRWQSSASSTDPSCASCFPLRRPRSLLTSLSVTPASIKKAESLHHVTDFLPGVPQHRRAACLHQRFTYMGTATVRNRLVEAQDTQNETRQLSWESWGFSDLVQRNHLLTSDNEEAVPPNEHLPNIQTLQQTL